MAVGVYGDSTFHRPDVIIDSVVAEEVVRIPVHGIIEDIFGILNKGGG
jgi:hypothetical protein